MRFYLSHAIRGEYGKDATYTQMKENCDKAILIANCIRNALPSIDLYVPGEHEFPPVGIFIKKGYITPEQALDVDCTIIDDCEGVIVYVPSGDRVQGGRKIEVDYADKSNKPVWVFENVEYIINRLAQYILGS